MVRLDQPALAEQPPRQYDPDTETDPLLRQYVTLPPLSSGKNDPVIRASTADITQSGPSS